MDTCWSLTVLAILILSIAGIFPVLCRFYSSAQVMQEKALSSGQIYTSSKNFTLTPIATDVRTVSHPWKILGWIHAEKKTNLNLKRRESFWVATFSRSIVDPNFQLEEYFPAFSSFTDSNCPFSDKSSRVQIRAWNDDDVEDFCSIKNLDFRIQWGPQSRPKSEKFWGGFQCDRHSIPALLCQYH